MAIKNHKSIEFLAESELNSCKEVMKRVAAIQKIDQVFKTLIDQELANHCQVANYRNGQVIIEVESAAWATLLRFQLPTLLSEMRQQGLASVASLDYYILTRPTEKPVKKLSVAKNLNPENAQYLQDIAAGMTDSKLKEALEKLSRHAQKNNKIV